MTRGDPAQRREAFRLLNLGFRQSEVAEKLDVSRAAVSKWAKRHRELGDRAVEGLAPGPRGRRMTPDQVRLVLAALVSEPQAPVRTWTVVEVRDLVQELLGWDTSTKTVRRYLEDWGLYRRAELYDLWRIGGGEVNDEYEEWTSSDELAVWDREAKDITCVWATDGEWHCPDETRSLTAFVSWDARRHLRFSIMASAYQAAAHDYLAAVHRLTGKPLVVLAADGTQTASLGEDPPDFIDTFLVGSLERLNQALQDGVQFPTRFEFPGGIGESQ